MTRRRGSDIPAVRTKWLLPGMLPAGRIVTVSGPSATGKSTFTAGLIGELTRLGYTVGLYSPEEVWAEDITPRLTANNVVLDSVVELTEDDVHSLETEDGARHFIEVIREEGLAAVVIDPITSAAGIDANRPEQVRPLLENLAGGCARYNFVLILILHDRKGSAMDVGPSADMVKGSQEWTAVPRVNLRLALDPVTADGHRAEVRRLVGPVATNLSGMVGCREALSVEVAPAAWQWQWTTDDLGRGIEYEWGQRRAQTAAAAQTQGRDRGGETNARRSVEVRAERVQQIVEIVEMNNGSISRNAVAEVLGVSPQILRINEKSPEFLAVLRAETTVLDNGGNGPTVYRPSG